ncbi:MAG TPA: serine hydrolase [Sphingomonas sp.]|jgi:beta-lactamase class A|uniref:serine hydrolase n=1 Tax=Sphingomonas sp. TaxID=28214 RepID=UPI002ED80655
MRALAPALLIAGIAAPVSAQPGIAPLSGVAARAAALIPILNGGGAPAEIFTAAFLTDVPEPRLRAIAAQLAAQYGRAERIGRITPAGGTRYDLTITYAQADVAATLTLEPAAPARIAGLRITGGSARLPDLNAVVAALRTLPGATGLAVARLGDGAPALLAARDADRPQAIGSTFKLLVLAELVGAIDAGTRRWTDVVPLTVRAVPSGILQDWPQDAPLTLHSLAALMISRSDNSATDTLVALLGRDRVAAMAGPLGWPAHPGNDPLLTTLEAAKLKAAAGGTLAVRYAGAGPADRRALLAGPVAALSRDAIDVATLETRPSAIATIEWFASPNAVVHTLDWFRRTAARPGSAAAIALALLAINPALPRTDAARFAYVGYKGGSEAGVLALSYLLRTPGGTWYAVSASWNDPVATVAEARMTALVTRAVQLVAGDDR